MIERTDIAQISMRMTERAKQRLDRWPLSACDHIAGTAVAMKDGSAVIVGQLFR